METVIVYLSLSFFILWVVAFSFSMGTLVWFQAIHLIHSINNKLDELARPIADFINRILFYLHLSR